MWQHGVAAVSCIAREQRLLVVDLNVLQLPDSPSSPLTRSLAPSLLSSLQRCARLARADSKPVMKRAEGRLYLYELQVGSLRRVVLLHTGWLIKENSSPMGYRLAHQGRMSFYELQVGSLRKIVRLCAAVWLSVAGAPARGLPGVEPGGPAWRRI